MVNNGYQQSHPFRSYEKTPHLYEIPWFHEFHVANFHIPLGEMVVFNMDGGWDEWLVHGTCTSTPFRDLGLSEGVYPTSWMVQNGRFY